MVVPLRSRHPAPAARPSLATLLGEDALLPALVPLLDQMNWVIRETVTSDRCDPEVLRDSVWLFAEEAKRAGLSRAVMLYQLLACVQRNGGTLSAERRRQIVETCCDWAERRYEVAD